MPIGPLAELALDDWERMIDVNVKGVLWGIAAALPIFQRQKAGHFITIASTAARKIVPNMAVYSGTKAAVAALMDGLRQEVAGSLRVTTIYPGYTDTNFANHVRNAEVRAQLKEAGDSYAMPPNAVAATEVRSYGVNGGNFGKPAPMDGVSISSTDPLLSKHLRGLRQWISFLFTRLNPLPAIPSPRCATCRLDSE
jgi:NAD(P)-dependent dehydrogenase (short-subunit alcohol dehydrogenase family)